MWGRVRGTKHAVPPGLRPMPTAPSVVIPPAEASPLHEAILAWLDGKA